MILRVTLDLKICWYAQVCRNDLESSKESLSKIIVAVLITLGFFKKKWIILGNIYQFVKTPGGVGSVTVPIPLNAGRARPATSSAEPWPALHC